MATADEPSELRYRWIVVAAAAVMMAVAMGAIVNGAAAFVVPLQERFGWSRAEASLVNFAGIMGLAFGGIAMGRLADRCGTRPIVFLGAVVLGLCYTLAGFANAPWHYYGLMFIAGFLGAGAIFAPVLAAVGAWFVAGAGVALGIASAGQALGQGAVPFISTFLIAEFGIDGAFLATGLFMLATLVPMSLLLRTPPPLSGSAQAMRSSQDAAALEPREAAIWLSVATVLCCTCMSIPLMHLVPLIQDRGFAAPSAGAVMLVMMLAGILGRLAIGVLSDRIGAIPAYMGATAWMGLMVFGFTRIETLATFYAYGALYGFGYAGVMTGVLATTRALTPISHLGSVMGVVGLFAWIGHANGGFLGGYLFDLTGDHAAAYGVAAVSAGANLVVMGLLYRRTQGPGGATATA